MKYSEIDFGYLLNRQDNYFGTGAGLAIGSEVAGGIEVRLFTALIHHLYKCICMQGSLIFICMCYNSAIFHIFQDILFVNNSIQLGALNAVRIKVQKSLRFIRFA